MIRHLRFQFVAVSMGVLTVVVAAAFCLVGGSMRRMNETQSLLALEVLLQNDGQVGAMDSEEPELSGKGLRAFYVQLDGAGNVLDILGLERAGISRSRAEALCGRALALNAEAGETEGFRFLRESRAWGWALAFCDKTTQAQMQTRLELVLLGVGALVLILLLGLVTLLSGWVARPVARAFEQQKRFIADASHELKTPLTVISVNLSVLEGEVGENKWLTYIREEVRRMRLLTGELVSLMRAESPETRRDFAPFDLSRAVSGAALPFESVAYEAGVAYDPQIDPGLRLNGSDSEIRQLTSILLENAFKHVEKGGKVALTLRASDRRVRLEVYGTGEGIPREDLEKIFERFYRGDASRSRDTGGSGLGLAIARAIVQKHGGRIFAQSEEGAWARFVVIL